jgi:hypothetical protein
MKKIATLSFVCIITAITLSLFSTTANSNPEGAPAGNTGSPADGTTCSKSGCHNGTPVTQAGIITSNVPTTGYLPGNTYNITVSLSGSGKKGFQVSPQDINGNVMGSLIAGTGTKILGTKYITHTAAKSTTSCTWTFQWIAPAAGKGAITFYGAFAITQDATKKSTLIIPEASTVQGVSNEANAKISVYPNPASDFIQIKLTDPISFGKAMLFDLSGKLVLTENFESNEFSMNVQSIPAGSYYLRVTDGQHQYFNHFVKK